MLSLFDIQRFDALQRKTLRRLTTPAKIQNFLDEEIAYNLEPRGATCYSPRLVLREKVAHCMEGAMLAALALRHLGHPALLVDLEAVRDSDHVLAVYRVNGRWGALAKSDYAGLRSREPVYLSIRELAMSYFEHYYNAAGEKTLRAYSRPVNLARFDSLAWMTTPTSSGRSPTTCAGSRTPACSPRGWSGAWPAWTAVCSRRGAWAASVNRVSNGRPSRKPAASIRTASRPPRR